MRKLKKLLAVALAVCLVTTTFVTPITASGQTYYTYDVEGGSIGLVDGLGYFYGVKYSNGATGYAGSYDPNGLILCNADSTITEAVIPSTYSGYASSSSGGDYEEGEGPYLEDEPITAIQGITGGDSGAFYGCTLLTSVTIPSTVKYIYGGAFAGCTSLTEVIFEDNDYYCYVDGAIYTKDMTTLVCYIDGSRTSFVVPDTVTEIGGFAFVGAPSLTSITIPASVTTIGTGALTGNSLTTVTFEQGSLFVAEDNLIFNSDKTTVLSYYGSVSGVTIPTSVTEIGEYAFWGVDISGRTSSTSASRRISSIYYQGTEAQWEAVTVAESNLPSYGELNVYYSCYAVNINDVENGTVSIRTSREEGIYWDNYVIDSTTYYTSGGEYFAEEGATITLYVDSDSGYSLSNISVTDDEGNSVDVTLTSSYEYYYFSSYTYTFTMPASEVSISADFEENEVVHTFTQDNTDAYSFDFSDYLTDFSVGDSIIITATLESDSYYGGALGANNAGGWAQTEYSNGSDYDDTVYVSLMVTSQYDYPYGSGQVQLWWIGGTYVNLTSLTVQKVYFFCTHDSLTHVEAVDATCTEDGNTEYWYCADCDTYFSDEDATTEITLDDTVVASTGHSYEETVTEPTCTEGGYTTHTCSACGDSYTDSETEALGHSYTSEVVKEPTCTENGLVTYTCSACGDTYSEETEATGHSYEATDSSATCTESGYTTYTCSVCGDTYTDDETEALGHDYTSEVTTEATCTEAGVMTYTCSRCGDSYTEEIAATGHTAGTAVRENVVEATSTTEGSYDLVTYCTVCGEELSRETVIVPVKGTDMVTVWLRTPANYTEVNNAIAKADALNPDDYTNFSDVTDAINAVDWSYNALMQAYVTDMANAIETAIANLIPVSATIEDINIVEPIESTDTDEEPDEDTSELATPVETNPTTGIALSIIPIAIAALAAVSSKRR